MGFAEGESDLLQSALGEASLTSSYGPCTPAPLFDEPTPPLSALEKYTGPFSIPFHIDGLPLHAGTNNLDVLIASSGGLIESKSGPNVLSNVDISYSLDYLRSDPFEDPPSYDTRVAQGDFATAFAQRVRLEQGYGHGHKVAFERDGKTYDERKAEPDKYGLQDAYQAEEDALKRLRDEQNILQRHDIQKEPTLWKRLALSGNIHGAVEKRIEEALEDAVDWATQWDRPPVRDAARKVLKKPIKKLFAPALAAVYTVACSVPNGLPTSQTNTPEAPHATPTHLVASPTIGSPNDGFVGAYVPGISGGVPGISGREVSQMPLTSELSQSLAEFGYKPVASVIDGALVVSETWMPDGKPDVTTCIPAQLEKYGAEEDPGNESKALIVQTDFNAIVETQLGNGSPQVTGNGDPDVIEYRSRDGASKQVALAQYSLEESMPSNVTCVNTVVFDAAKSPNPNDRNGTPAMVFVDKNTTQVVGYMPNTFSADTDVTVQTTDGFSTFVDGVELKPTFLESVATTTPAPTFTATATHTPEITATIQPTVATAEATQRVFNTELPDPNSIVLLEWREFPNTGLPEGVLISNLVSEQAFFDAVYEEFGLRLSSSYAGESSGQDSGSVFAVIPIGIQKFEPIPGYERIRMRLLGYGPSVVVVFDKILTAFGDGEHSIPCSAWSGELAQAVRGEQTCEQEKVYTNFDELIKGKPMLISILTKQPADVQGYEGLHYLLGLLGYESVHSAPEEAFSAFNSWAIALPLQDADMQKLIK